MQRPSVPVPSPLSSHAIEVTVGVSDIDELDHASNIAYVRWIQDVAVAHSCAVGLDFAAYRLLGAVFVVRRHEIDYLRPAMPGDGLKLRTRVGTAAGRVFERHTEILRAADARVLARARTLWCPLDPRTLKVVEVDDEVRARFSGPVGE